MCINVVCTSLSAIVTAATKTTTTTKRKVPNLEKGKKGIHTHSLKKKIYFILFLVTKLNELEKKLVNFFSLVFS